MINDSVDRIKTDGNRGCKIYVPGLKALDGGSRAARTRGVAPLVVPADDVADGGHLAVLLLQAGQGRDAAQGGGDAAEPLRAPEVARALHGQGHRALAPCARQ